MLRYKLPLILIKFNSIFNSLKYIYFFNFLVFKSLLFLVYLINSK